MVTFLINSFSLPPEVMKTIEKKNIYIYIYKDFTRENKVPPTFIEQRKIDIEIIEDIFVPVCSTVVISIHYFKFDNFSHFSLMSV